MAGVTADAAPCRDQEGLDRRPGDVSAEIAALLTSGVHGRALLQALFDRFGGAKRFEVFLGVALAVTQFETWLTMSETEVVLLLHKLAGRERGGDAA